MLVSGLKTNPIQEVLNLIQNRFGFETELNGLSNQLEPALIIRLNKWFTFFNENYNQCFCLYEQTIFALIVASKKNELFRTQTIHEFELSLVFYQKIIDSKISIKIKILEEALKLLSISLIFGKYPKMILGSLNKLFSNLNKHIPHQNIDSIFKMLFVKYEVPTVFISNLYLLSSTEVEALMFILQGNNIRNFKYLPFPISKKESYYLINKLTDIICFLDKILEHATICAKILITKPDKINLLYFFLGYSRTFRDDPELFYKDLDFWKRAFNLINQINFHYEVFHIREYVDYFEYKKYVERTPYSLKGRTLYSVTLAIHQWHQNASFAKDKGLNKISWIGKDSSVIKYNYNGKYFLFKEITNGTELMLESSTLKHCVFSYANQCISGKTTIWSLRKKTEEVFTPFITIELVAKRIVQIHGKSNRTITKSEYNLIAMWAENKQFEIGDYFSYD